jgi:hypothetical protein
MSGFILLTLWAFFFAKLPFFKGRLFDFQSFLLAGGLNSAPPL